MRVVALVSGGKDSCYSMMKCVEHGHTIVALANLHPPTQDVDEMDSFMYQTVGHQHVNAIAQSMELPLFRQEIGGSAVLQGMRYERTEGDEVEDLLTLLATVQREMPSVEAVCSGAILSNYQRYRVEDVCARLGLASLSYLWQREQDELLQEMAAAGVHAVLVKVCSLGLDERHLNKSIAELHPHFRKLHGRFGFHICGEGGEYETFTLDCPLFRRRLEPEGVRAVKHATDASVSLLCFDRLVLREKLLAGKEEAAGEVAAAEVVAEAEAGAGAGAEAGAGAGAEAGAGADVGEEAAAEAAEAAEAARWAAVEAAEAAEDAAAEAAVEAALQAVEAAAEEAEAAEVQAEGEAEASAAPWRLSCDEAILPMSLPMLAGGEAAVEHVSLGGVHGGCVHVIARAEEEAWAGLEEDGEGVAAAAAVETQLTCALGRVSEALRQCGLGLEHVLYVRLYVSRMAQYAALNAAYSAAFAGRPPAARAAVELPLGAGRALCLEAVACGNTKQLLHVQSISEWAPRMIGPYCQLTAAHGVALVAGNLGLDPASMRLVAGGTAAQAAQALANCAAVLQGLSFEAMHTLQMVFYLTADADAAAVRGAARRWLREHGAAGVALLLLQVGALPMGALVEVQLEAAAAATPALAQHSFTLTHGRLQLACHLTVSGASTAQAYADRAGGASPPGGAEPSAAGDGSLEPSPVAALGTLQCLVSLAAGAEAGAEAAEVPVAQLVGSLCEAQRQMRELLEARKLCAGRAQHVRAFCEARLLPPAALRGALLEAVAGEPCAVLVLPVERVRSGQARLAVQLHFAVDARRTVDAEE